MKTKLKEGAVIKTDSLEGEWLVISMWEEQPRITIGNRSSSYENGFVISKLDDDGAYNKNNQINNISTAFVFSNSINEIDIDVIRMMEKSFK